MSLFGRIFLLNAAVLSAATVLLVLGPVTVSTPALFTEVLILVLGLAAALVATAVLLRVGLAPLQRLTREMTTIDLLRPGPRLRAEGHGQVDELIRTFNTMLDRLAAERGASTARALSAQEGERRRVARELHDEVGQSLTVVLLELKRVAADVPEPAREALHQVQETTRGTLDEVRRIARRLRPGVLDELGLVSAVKSLAGEAGELVVRRRFSPDLPPLDPQAELVVYRVAQEGLTNVVRHAKASTVDLSLESTGDGVELRVRDDGRGLGDAAEGAGITGMRERALLIGARLTVASTGAGTEVRLLVPLGKDAT